MIGLHKEFRCPACGSSHFGSSRSSAGIDEGHCHGCHNFSWPREDDEKYSQLRRSALEKILFKAKEMIQGRYEADDQGVTFWMLLQELETTVKESEDA